MPRTCPGLLCLSLLASAGLAQLNQVVAPANYAATEANSSSGLPSMS